MIVAALVTSWVAALRAVNQDWGRGTQLRIALCNDQRPRLNFLFYVFLSGARAALSHPRTFLAALRRTTIISTRPNHPATVNQLSSWNADVGLHGLGVIYTEALISAFRLGILNAHIGLLPAYRGRCVMEWALLEGSEIAISTFFINQGIDEGAPIVLVSPVALRRESGIAEEKQALFRCDMAQYAGAVHAIMNGHPGKDNPLDEGRRYYPMSRLFSNIVESILNDGLHDAVLPTKS